jgi:hypothetical protein
MERLSASALAYSAVMIPAQTQSRLSPQHVFLAAEAIQGTSRPICPAHEAVRDIRFRIGAEARFPPRRRVDAHHPMRVNAHYIPLLYTLSLPTPIKNRINNWVTLSEWWEERYSVPSGTQCVVAVGARKLRNRIHHLDHESPSCSRVGGPPTLRKFLCRRR